MADVDPWAYPEEIEPEKHWQNINRILETCQTERGIETNKHRELLIMQKPRKKQKAQPRSLLTR